MGEAAQQLIRLTSEDSDLRSALLLEQVRIYFSCEKKIISYNFVRLLIAFWVPTSTKNWQGSMVSTWC